jgi:4-alpha-glucanotransferase
MWTHAAHQNRVSARAACTAEQADTNFAATHDNKTFAEFYGKNGHDRNAFNKCVSSKTKAALEQQQSNTQNAAQSCKAERSSMGGPAFRAKYGKSGHDRNAFGKCVSQLSKSTT